MESACGLRGMLSLWTAYLVASAVGNTCPDEAPGALKQSCTGPRTPAEYLQSLNAYDPTRRPPCGNDTHEGPTIIEVQMRVIKLHDVDAKRGSFSISGYFRSWWTDPRLAYNSTDAGGCMDLISLPMPAQKTNLWAPDLYIDNLLSVEEITNSALTQISPDGGVWQSVKVDLSLTMAFDLSLLPYDVQVAKIVVASYSQDIRNLRVIPKGGTVGLESPSGIGIAGKQIHTLSWSIYPPDEDGFTTPGMVSTDDGWDYVTLSWTILRRPQFYETQVLLPCGLFTLVSYIQFFVSSEAVPARAALAVIPVLIMRTMSDSVYRALPDGSQFMLLSLFVTLSMFLSVAAAVEFAVVEFLRTMQQISENRLAGLMASKQVVKSLIGIATHEHISLLTLVKRFEPQERAFTKKEVEHQEKRRTADRNLVMELRSREDLGSPAHDSTSKSVKSSIASIVGVNQGRAAEAESQKEDEVPDDRNLNDGEAGVHVEEVVDRAEAREAGIEIEVEPDGETETRKLRSAASVKESVLEADLLPILVTAKLFMKYDLDNSNLIDAEDLRGLLKFFGIYMSTSRTAAVICMYLRDHDVHTDLDESKVELTFSQAIGLLISIEEYKLSPHRTLRQNFGSWKDCKNYFQCLPPSDRVDVLARIAFPFLVLMQFLTYWSIAAGRPSAASY